ncbi:hypothetical protein NEF87_004414 [Candidatus Lokiarchaeum ossiferum]|uniref:Uncharacterized protein n=1 Tax=Candidatus Lokiarchaeum ossiferum TaxID=2951803 RepID=A0ABY6HX71_9ARCH|nr:hypothetical protein NEF87_004414 [Candidatus Lokiarchaeum sp. B-35]
MSYQDEYTQLSDEMNAIDNAQDTLVILQELGKICKFASEFEFSTGKWSKAWFKIKFKRKEIEQKS